MMMDLSGQKIRKGQERPRTILVECEICDCLVQVKDCLVQVKSDHAGVIICAACQRDIVSPYLPD